MCLVPYNYGDCRARRTRSPEGEGNWSSFYPLAVITASRTRLLDISSAGITQIRMFHESSLHRLDRLGAQTKVSSSNVSLSLAPSTPSLIIVGISASKAAHMKPAPLQKLLQESLHCLFEVVRLTTVTSLVHLGCNFDAYGLRI